MHKFVVAVGIPHRYCTVVALRFGLKGNLALLCSGSGRGDGGSAVTLALLRQSCCTARMTAAASLSVSFTLRAAPVLPASETSIFKLNLLGFLKTRLLGLGEPVCRRCPELGLLYFQ